ncbi:hypothetical protein E1B28_010433 [Marasmius oreades]|uniref:Uncharacterized protein n=1 Tax=Marasmius oreades TaxID=181124 RepID=A0A9P7USP5_9AGAR|nr:uncharacterized protein E1B28_010433 [Marasmius oreades]KAG7091396.1 hypothetical protein E1B28_010433 [Marasmius oreades]
MKGLLLSASLLLSVLLAKAQPPAGDPPPADQCPNGTWHLVENPVGSGEWEWECKSLACPGDTADAKRNYYNSVTDTVFRCCPTTRQLVIYDQASRVGVCCAAGLVYLGTAPNGQCCTPGQILQDGKCADPPTIPQGPPEGCPSQPNNVCKLKKACGTAAANGLQYGSCYQITFPIEQGPQLGRGTDAAVNQYKMGGHIQNIPFKVCKTTADCGTGAVQATDTFYIQDQIGLAGDGTAAVAWLDNAAAPALISAVNAVATAGQFKGQTSCSACKCVVSLTGAASGLAMRGDQTNSALTFIPNKQSFVDLEFSQVTCDNSVIIGGATPGPKVPLLKVQIPLKV